MSRFDVVVKGGRVLVPGMGPTAADVAVRDGRVAALGLDGFAPADAEVLIDARDCLVLPGAIDSHFHLGIYRALDVDTRSETASAVTGGVTTVLSYFRTGSHYLDRSGPYRDIFPEVVRQASGNAKTDFGFHLAPVLRSHVDEIPWLVEEWGVTSFKYFMFYKGFNLAGNSRDTRAFLMSEDDYDLGHLYEIMEKTAEVGRQRPERLSVSLHAEHAELLRVFIQRARQDPAVQGLAEYDAARPQLTERLAIEEAAVLADATGAAINYLHLSGQGALDAATGVAQRYPALDVHLETTLHHLCLDLEHLHGLGGKVNPPIRRAQDNEHLWAACADGRIRTVVSDHACCMEHDKQELWPAFAGFGGSALLYPLLFSEGHLRRGIPLQRIVDLVATTPARLFNLAPAKGAIAVGSDADLCILDPSAERVVTPSLLRSAQDHTPFDGLRVTGWPRSVLLRGTPVLENGEPSDGHPGRYVRRRQDEGADRGA